MTPTPEKIVSKYEKKVDGFTVLSYNDILLAVKEYGDLRAIEMRGKALDWAADNAKTIAKVIDRYGNTEDVVDKSSILSGKTAEELQC